MGFDTRRGQVLNSAYLFLKLHFLQDETPSAAPGLPDLSPNPFPSLDTLQPLHVLLVMKGPKLIPGFEVPQHSWECHFHDPPGHTSQVFPQNYPPQTPPFPQLKALGKDICTCQEYPNFSIIPTAKRMGTSEFQRPQTPPWADKTLNKLIRHLTS